MRVDNAFTVVGKSLMGVKENSKLSTAPRKIIIEKFTDNGTVIRRKTVISEAGKAVAELKGDTLTINGGSPASLIHAIGEDITPKTAMQTLFDGFEKLFVPNNRIERDLPRLFPSK